MEQNKSPIETKSEDLQKKIESDDEQLTVEIPVEVRAGRAYGCCKRLA